VKKYLAILGIILFLTGCATKNVHPISKTYKIKHICIQDNPKVIVGGFIDTIITLFENHGISSEIYTGKLPENCEYRLRYTALKTWDIDVYMHHAELHLYKKDKKIGSGIYHLTGGGGLDLSKFESIEKKMAPIVDELLNDQ